tara:strand:+ start:281 stop:1129 length:849 start_codon:yes stop_codon:yes gene_type:complete
MWYDREILAGDVLDDEISRELEAADLFLLLVSPDFINSNYCVEREMRRALERHDAGEARIVPIIVEPCEWKEISELRRLKAVPEDGDPISEWTNANNAYLNVVQEIRRIVDASETDAPKSNENDPAPAAPRRDVPRYRVQRDFDDIDRSEYRDTAFVTIKDYFRRATEEINAMDGLRGRFVDRRANSFGSTVVNQGRQSGTAHITVHCRNSDYALSDIYYSFNENAAENTANGGFNVSSDEYEQFLTVTMSMFGNEPDRLNPGQAAEYLWNQFIEQAGITHA